MQLYPSLSLSEIVKHYLIIQDENEVHADYRLFSDGNPGLVFHFKEPFLQERNNLVGHMQPQSFVYGQLTHFNDIRSSGKLDMLIVVLQPNALHALVDLSAFELNDATISLHTVFGQEGTDVEEQVFSAQHVGTAIKAIEGLLLRRLKQFERTDVVVKGALSIINQANGIISIMDLLKELPVTERQLERKFKHQVGISPKKFADVIKFQYFLKSMQKSSPVQKLTSTIYACGYYDQAHLNNCFKKYVGVTPLQYRSNDHLLAINLMEVR